MKKNSIPLLLIFLTAILYAQEITVNKIEPPNWWTGMKLNKIQLLVYGKNLDGISARFNGEKIKVERIDPTDNPNHAFIEIEIPEGVEPGIYDLILKRGKVETVARFPLLKRESKKNRFRGFSNGDLIYLVMPDRFANGDLSNDSIPGYSDSMSGIPGEGRAGGDIQGMIDKLDYIKDFGFTAIWPTPLTENNTFRSYHGYAATDFYKIDPRLGTNELYKKFVDEAHSRGLKIILDHVSNHCSDDHPWLKNPPMRDWLNGTIENHLDARHEKMEFTDPYADSSTINEIERGWFVNHMPDLNESNPRVANYIIENTLWWVEYSGLDGIREDTYPYNNQKFMARWAKTIMEEYPSLNIVGEVWTGDPAFLAGYQKDTFLPRSFNTNLPAMTDFGLRDILIKYLSGETGLYSIFELLAKDYLYKDADNLVTFADNHDTPRVMYFAKGNRDKVKIVYTILLTLRGIPQIFYGSEIGMVGTDHHGQLRLPFPGGFPGDKRDAFSHSGRTKEENEIYDFLHRLIDLRKTHPALSKGKLIHFPPVKEIYIYFRILGNEEFKIIVNGGNSESQADLKIASGLISGNSVLLNLLEGGKEKLDSSMRLKIGAMKAEIYKISN